MSKEAKLVNHDALSQHPHLLLLPKPPSPLLHWLCQRWDQTILGSSGSSLSFSVKRFKMQKFCECDDYEDSDYDEQKGWEKGGAAACPSSFMTASQNIWKLPNRQQSQRKGHGWPLLFVQNSSCSKGTNQRGTSPHCEEPVSDSQVHLCSVSSKLYLLVSRNSGDPTHDIIDTKRKHHYATPGEN